MAIHYDKASDSFRITLGKAVGLTKLTLNFDGYYFALSLLTMPYNVTTLSL